MRRGSGRHGRSPTAAIGTLVAVAVLLGAGSLAGVATWVLGGELIAAGEPVPTARAANAASAESAGDRGYRVWARNDDGSAVRWDPCSPIELVVAPEGAPAGFHADLEEAARRVAEATGLELRVSGTTDEQPDADRSPYQPQRYGERWAPVLVAWTSPDDPSVPLRDIDRAVATPVAVGPAGDRTYVTGQLVFNRDRTDLAAGFDDRATSWGATILHELGHLVGLDHTDEADELMAVHPGRGPVAFGRGDRDGLEAVGADGGCLEVLDPQPVEVVRYAE